MAVPKQKHNKSRKNKRRTNKKLSGVNTSICPKCKKPVLPHTACSFCGTYKGKEVIDVSSKLSKKEKKQKEKEMAQRREEEKSKKPLSPEELSKKQ